MDETWFPVNDESLIMGFKKHSVFGLVFVLSSFFYDPSRFWIKKKLPLYFFFVFERKVFSLLYNFFQKSLALDEASKNLPFFNLCIFFIFGLSELCWESHFAIMSSGWVINLLSRQPHARQFAATQEIFSQNNNTKSKLICVHFYVKGRD